MKQITVNGHLMVGNLPKDAHDFKVLLDEDGRYVLKYYSLLIRGVELYFDDIGAKPCEVVNWAKNATEEQWDEIVEFSQLADADEEHDGGYMNYQTMYWQFNTAKESGHSLLKYHSLDPGTTLILKEK